jgi:hypothetical protein
MNNQLLELLENILDRLDELDNPCHCPCYKPELMGHDWECNKETWTERDETRECRELLKSLQCGLKK